MIGVVCAVALYVLAPLRRRAAPEAWATERDQLLRAREAVYQVLRDIELDRETGKLGAADYVTLRARFRAEAVAVLHRLDALAAASTGAARAEPPASVGTEHGPNAEAAPPPDRGGPI